MYDVPSFDQQRKRVLILKKEDDIGSSDDEEEKREVVIERGRETFMPSKRELNLAKEGGASKGQKR